MTNFAFPPVVTTLPVHNSNVVFPVRRVFCVGQNYAAHSIEMGGNPDRDPPFFFAKPHDAVVHTGANVPYPVATNKVHHEAELVIAIGKGGAGISVEAASDHIYGFATGNDLTRRDIQAVAKSKGRPWDMAKGFDQSAVIGTIHPISETGLMQSGAITCDVDGSQKQTGDLDQMIWKTPEIIAYLSGLVSLAAGDLIMTGTPAGVGPIESGQTCTVRIDGLSDCTVSFY